MASFILVFKIMIIWKSIRLFFLLLPSKAQTREHNQVYLKFLLLNISHHIASDNVT
jgi:hypothetical protein